MNNLLDSKKLFIMAGPCVIESEETTFQIAQKIKSITEELDIQFIFKASYKKQNRTKLNSFTGPGLEEGIKILKKIKTELNIPITTDVHSAEEVKKVEKVIDIIQIPAFLCRQTDILIAAAKTKKYVNVKKGQFLSGSACKFIIEKIKSAGNDKVIITERGNSFGYTDLVVDMRNIPVIKSYNVPIFLDVTHSNQKPNQVNGISGGTPQFINTLAYAGIASGVNGVFIETHPQPLKALSDGSNMLPLKQLKPLLKDLNQLKKLMDQILSSKLS